MIRRVSTAALIFAAGLASPALAQDGAGQRVLEGEAAFGGWEDDSPGTLRHIQAADIPAPTPEASEANGAQPVPRPDGALPAVAENFEIALVADDLERPRTLKFAPNGDLFVADSGAGTIRVMRFAEGSAQPTETGTFAQGLTRPYGIAFYPPENPQWVYVGEANALVRYPYREGDMIPPAEKEVLAELPTGGHWTRDVAVSPDGETIYVAVGSDSNVGDGTMDLAPEVGLEAWQAEQPLGAAWGSESERAALLAFAPDGSNKRIYATGLRNCSGLTIQPTTGMPWCSVNERDGLGNNVPFDYATAVQQGAFYGWPWYYIGANADPRWSEAPRADLDGQVTVPDVLFQSHSAPLGITFVPSAAWGEEYEGDAFVAMHGSWNRGTRTGYKVVRLDFEDGKPTGTYEDFVTGMVQSSQEVWGRPVGVAFGPDGALYFSEDGNGSIWKVSRQQ